MHFHFHSQPRKLLLFLFCLLVCFSQFFLFEKCCYFNTFLINAVVSCLNILQKRCDNTIQKFNFEGNLNVLCIRGIANATNRKSIFLRGIQLRQFPRLFGLERKKKKTRRGNQLLICTFDFLNHNLFKSKTMFLLMQKLVQKHET